MGEFIKVRGLPTHGRIHQGKGAVYLLMGEVVKVKGFATHGKICEGKGSTHSWENSSR